MCSSTCKQLATPNINYYIPTHNRYLCYCKQIVFIQLVEMSFDEQSKQDIEETELILESNHEEKQDTITNSEERESSMDDEEKHEEKLGLLEGDVGGPQVYIYMLQYNYILYIYPMECMHEGLLK